MPEQPQITVRCPECKVVLRIKSAPRPEQIITCPKCGRRHPFSQYVPVRLVKRPDVTQPQPVPSPRPATPPAPVPPPFITGIASLQFAGKTYPLRLGRNVVGRQATTSSADIQLPDNSRYMSREHFAIDVEPLTGPGYNYRISPVKDFFQPTSVDGQPLVAGKSLPLHSGARIVISPAGAAPIEIILS